MPTTLRLRVLDRPFGVVVEPAARARLTAQWSRCLDGADPPPAEVLGHGEGPDADRLDYSLASRLTGAAIALRAGELMMLHACGIADPATGAALALVAPSGTGKTTAARTLGSAGWSYLTDETVAFDADRRVLPYPKPLSVVIDPARDAGHKSQHGPDELGLGATVPHARIARFVLLHRDPALAAPTVEPVGLIDALVALVPQSSALARMDRPLRTLAGHVTATGGARVLRYAEIADTDALLRAELAPARAAEPFEALPPGPHEVAPDPLARVHLAPAQRYADWNGAPVIRTRFTDAIATDDEVLVLIGSSPVRLPGLAATIWRAGARACTGPQLTAACVDAHGAHPDAGDLVADTVRTMLAHGALRLAD